MSEEFQRRVAAADQLRDAGDLAGALLLYEDITRDDPKSATGPYKQGTALGRLGRNSEAEQRYRDALAIDENYPEALNNLAALLVARGEWDEADTCFRHALAEKPDYFEACLGYSHLLLMAWRVMEALHFSRRACALNPTSAVAFERTGIILRKLGRIGAALTSIRRATELDPGLAAPWGSLAATLQSLGRHREADEAYAAAVGAGMAAGGKDPLPHSNFAYFSNYLDIPRAQSWERHRAFGAWARQQLGAVPVPAITTRPQAGRRLRVGFVSGDLRRHSVAYFVRGALEHLDRSQFQLFAYFDSHKEDDVSAWLKPMFHHWRDIFAKSHESALAQIREDRIDILVDLSGHTGANRTMLFARRAAPVQLSYLGYPNTTGLDTMDYRLTDIWADPAGDGDEFHAETLWRLPRSFLCYAPPETTPEVSLRNAAADSAVVFGSFNNRVKISEACMAAWIQILLRVPESRLVIKSIMGTEDEESREDLKQGFLDCGIAAERIEVLRFDDNLDDHLEHYAEIDIALDTFPYNGTTTTCEALWMGVPVVSLIGDRHAARVGSSLLSNAGLEEMVGESVEDYIRIAAELSADRPRLAQLRATMRERLQTSALLDRHAMSQAMGEALRGMWQGYCNGFSAELPVDDEMVKQDQPIRLHIGGKKIKEGWKIFDIEPRDEVDFVGDIRDLSAFAEASCVEVYASHVLEHLPPQDILTVLNGLHRLLVPGGNLYLSVPDFEVLCWLFVGTTFSKPEKFHVMQMAFGGQENEHDLHRIGLTFDFMLDYLKDVGFSSVEHVESFGLFPDASEKIFSGHRISLNLIVTK
jgi:protein O-GlcNAc transferase